METGIANNDGHRVLTRSEIRHRRKQQKRIRKGENIARIRAEQARINKKEKMKRNINVAKNLTTKRQIKQARGINH
jgi:hypothetical protein